MRGNKEKMRENMSKNRMIMMMMTGKGKRIMRGDMRK